MQIQISQYPPVFGSYSPKINYNCSPFFQIQIFALQLLKETMSEQYPKWRIKRTTPPQQSINQKNWFDCDPLLTMEVSQYCGCVSMMLQEMDRLCFQKSTKYLAKKYFDRFLTLNPKVEEKNLILIIITCMRIAAKLNEIQEVYSQYTVGVCLNQSNFMYLPQEFAISEQLLAFNLQFKLKIITPFDFWHDSISNAPNHVQLIHEIINYSLTLAQLAVFSSQQIYYGSLAYVCQQKPEIMDIDALKQTSKSWVKILKISQIIGQNLSADIQE